VALPDATQASIPALIGAAQEVDRLLVLMNLETSALGAGAAPEGAPAPHAATFTALLQPAQEAQAAALD
jgi:hypothetical protein